MAAYEYQNKNFVAQVEGERISQKSAKSQKDMLERRNQMILLFNLREFDRKALLDHRIHRGITISTIVLMFRAFPQCGEVKSTPENTFFNTQSLNLWPEH